MDILHLSANVIRK